MSEQTEPVAVQAEEPVQQVEIKKPEEPVVAADAPASEAGVEKAAETEAPQQAPEQTAVAADDVKSEPAAKPTPVKKEKRQSIVSKLLAFVREKSPKKPEEKKAQDVEKTESAKPVETAETAVATGETEASAPVETTEAVPSSLEEKPEESAKPTEEASKESAAPLASKEKIGRRLSTRLGGFFPKKEAKVAEPKPVDAAVKPIEAASDPVQASELAEESAKPVAAAAAA